MSTPTHAPEQSLRIGAEELRTRLESGEAAMLLDARGRQAWGASPDKIRGAIHIDPAHFHLDSSWPNDRLTVVY